MTFKASGSLVVAVTGQSTAVVVGGQGEHGILAEFTGIVRNVIMIVATFFDELLGLIECLLNQQIRVVLLNGHSHQIIQPNVLCTSVLQRHQSNNE